MKCSELMSRSYEEVKKEFTIKCNEILEDPEVRFCGLINGEGEKITGGFKKGVQPYEDDDHMKKIFMELAHRVGNRKSFDSKLGRVKYSSSRREKVVMMSFPIEGYVLLLIAEPNVNIDRLAYRIIQKIGMQWYEFFGL